MKLRFDITFTMKSDWHCGTGRGRHGALDRVVARDIDELPCLPEKTVIGLLRDAGERLVAGLDEGGTGIWHEWLEFVFGDQPTLRQDTDSKRLTPPAPLPAALSLEGPGRLDDALRQCLAGPENWRRGLRDALFLSKPGVAIDHATGTALDDHLREIEYVRQRLVLTTAGVVSGLDQSNAKTVAALLIGASTLLDRIGGKRQRGAGRCMVELAFEDSTKIEPQEVIDLLDGTPPEVPRREKSMMPSGGAIVSGQPDQWTRLPIRLEVLTPLLVTQETRGNTIICLDHLPGARLLPWLHRKLASAGIDVQTLVENEQLVLRPAYPDVDGVRGLPVPKALHLEKQESSGLFRNALIEPSATTSAQEKPIRQGWVGTAILGQVPYLSKTPTSHDTHGTIEDKSGRPQGSVGGVYSNEGIAVGTVLHSELLLPKAVVDQLPTNWYKALEGEESFGASRKDRGRVVVRTGEPEVLASGVQPTEAFTLWLTSDLLLRGDDLGPATTKKALAAALASALGPSIKVNEAAMRHRRQESWHTRWGRPRPSMIAIEAGSCFLVEADNKPVIEKLQALEALGLGERRVEGFGAVCVNHPLLCCRGGRLKKIATSKRVLEKAPTSAMLKGVGQAQITLGKTIEDAAWRQGVLNAALSIAANSEKRKELTPWDEQTTNAKLGRLRGMLQRYLDAPNNDDAAEIAERLPAALAKLASGQAVWSELERAGFESGMLLVSEADDLKRRHKREAIATLLFACMRAHRREQERSERPERSAA